jgi:hypothetical protein
MLWTWLLWTQWCPAGKRAVMDEASDPVFTGPNDVGT